MAKDLSQTKWHGKQHIIFGTVRKKAAAKRAQAAPAYMSFQLTSTEQADVVAMVDKLKALVAINELVWVDEQGKA